jgi:hypothetical protein
MTIYSSSDFGFSIEGQLPGATKPHHKEQIGDYVIELKNPRSMWGVRMAGAEEYLSQHNSKREALASVKRHQQANKRRRIK